MSNSSNYTKDVVVFFDGLYKNVKRDPILEFALPELLFRFQYQNPQLTPLFVFPSNKATTKETEPTEGTAKPTTNYTQKSLF